LSLRARPPATILCEEEVPEKEQEELKELIDKDFGLLELATNAGRDVKKGHECCLLSTAFVIPRDKWASTGFG
jgi:hypothetical protein